MIFRHLPVFFAAAVAACAASPAEAPTKPDAGLATGDGDEERGGGSSTPRAPSDVVVITSDLPPPAVLDSQDAGADGSTPPAPSDAGRPEVVTQPGVADASPREVADASPSPSRSTCSLAIACDERTSVLRVCTDHASSDPVATRARIAGRCATALASPCPHNLSVGGCRFQTVTALGCSSTTVWYDAPTLRTSAEGACTRNGGTFLAP